MAWRKTRSGFYNNDEPKNKFTKWVTRKNKKKPHSCPKTGKVRFRDQHQATQALERIHKNKSRAESKGVETKRREQRSYYCASCEGWHLTSQPDI